ncbi:hypothetical protein HDU98_002436, partial [Podochytrium sp. JEL0797]
IDHEEMATTRRTAATSAAPASSRTRKSVTNPASRKSSVKAKPHRPASPCRNRTTQGTKPTPKRLKDAPAVENDEEQDRGANDEQLCKKCHGYNHLKCANPDDSMDQIEGEPKLCWECRKKEADEEQEIFDLDPTRPGTRGGASSGAALMDRNSDPVTEDDANEEANGDIDADDNSDDDDSDTSQHGDASQDGNANEDAQEVDRESDTSPLKL